MMIHEQILTLRKQAGMTQEELARKVGVSRQTISHWELGDTAPDINQAKKLAEIFCIDLNDLVGLDKKEVIIENLRETKNTTNKTNKAVKLILAIIVCTISLFLFLIISKIISKNIYEATAGDIKEETITCKLHDKEYSYTFRFYETTGQIIEAGGDGYLAHITDIEKYDDAYQAIDVIDAYVKNNGGTCE